MSEVDSDKAAQHPTGDAPVTPQQPVKKDAPNDSKAPPKGPPPHTPPPKNPPPKTPSVAADSRGSGKGLAGLALLVALAGLAAGGYSVWQTRQLTAQEQQQLEAVQAAGQQARELDDRSQQLTNRIARLEQLPSAEQLEERRRLLGELQSDQQRLAGRVEQVLGASREQWRLAEAEHLLRMAMLRLSAMQDINSAKSLVAEADLILRKQDDPGAYGTRQKLLEGLEALRSLPEVDRTGLFLQLGALRGQANQLNGLAPVFENGEAASGQADSRWQRWANELTRYVRIDFNAGNDVKPLLAGQSLAQVRLALSLAIEQAQWAVLNGNQEVYEQSLQQASRLIADLFSEENGQSRGLRDRIEQLAGQQVAVTLPDLSPALEAMQSYVQKRESAEDRSASPPRAGDAPAKDAPADDTEQPAGAEQPAEEGTRT
ncbi:uroporphyrinogen-III C-methyltransferase [Pseudomonas sp.]|uniref:uroporphyrinogen-III C-methyltransferase n=1 Tax=Pseudomonas sp. TaxID=306 RepID=UPI00391938C6